MSVNAFALSSPHASRHSQQHTTNGEAKEADEEAHAAREGFGRRWLEDGIGFEVARLQNGVSGGDAGGDGAFHPQGGRVITNPIPAGEKVRPRSTQVEAVGGWRTKGCVNATVPANDPVNI